MIIRLCYFRYLLLSIIIVYNKYTWYTNDLANQRYVNLIISEINEKLGYIYANYLFIIIFVVYIYLHFNLNKYITIINEKICKLLNIIVLMYRVWFKM